MENLKRKDCNMTWVLGILAAVCVFAVFVMAINEARDNYESRGDDGDEP